MATTRVLVAEDNSITALDLRERLAGLGYEVVACADSGEQVVRLAGELRPDLILMDVMLKGAVDGIAAAEQVREVHDIPIVFLTAHSDVQTIRRARVAEPHGFILKPVEDRELHTAVEIALYKHAVEQRLRESEARYRALVETSPDAIAMTDLHGRFLAANQPMLALHGFADLEELQASGLSAFDMIAEQDRPRATDYAEATLRTGFTHWAEHLARRKDGSTFPAEIGAAAILDAAGQPYAFIVISRDITERKQAEERIAWLASFPERDPNPIAEVDLAGQVHYLNPAARALLPELPAAGLRHAWFAGWDSIAAGFQQGGAASVVREIPVGDRWYQQGWHYIAPSGRVRIYGLDITERRRAEDLRADSERKYRQLVELAQEGIWAIDAAANTTFVNPRMAEMLGYTVGEMLAKPLFAFMDERGVALAAADLERRRGGIREDHEFAFIRKDGARVYAYLATTPLTDDEGRYAGALAVVADITARKQAEEALRQYAAELEARNAELDAFAHTVAHDLKNPVAPIIGFADLLLMDLDGFTPDELRRAVQTIEQSARKLDSIIDELLLLAEVRKADVELRPLDMAGIVTEAQRRLAGAIAAAHAEIILPGAWPQALGYAPWVEEVWFNYLSNALKYGGQPPRAELGAALQPDGLVRFWVRDNGPGLTRDEQARLFAPFTRLAEVRARGHGLGLSIVRRIVEKLGGQAMVESEGVPGRGSVFSFMLRAPGS